MSDQEDKKIALVTGAGRGIGKAIALSLADEGYHIICVSRSESSCGAVTQQIPTNASPAESHALDVSDASAVEKTCEALLEKHGLINILVNNAGITKDNLVFRMGEEDWDAVLNTNLKSVFTFTKYLARPMTRKRWGRIINIASVIGLTGNAGQANYSAAKAGIIGLSKSLAKEFAARNVTVNVVAPGFIETDMTSILSEEQKTSILGVIPMKRMGKASDIANITTFLASEKSDYITGQVFTVDGGMVM